MTRGIIVAGLSGGSGKSVVSVGLTAALARTGHTVVPFKKGPDYIDAGWLKLAAGRNCYNLDPYLMSEEVIRSSFYLHGREADYVVLEGNRGLFDGVNPEGGYSTAELAMMLKMPVLLVVDCTKTTRTVAALVLGCQHLEPELDICGVILNRIGTERHQKVVTEAVERYTGLPVVGAVRRMKRDIFPMRHLGVTPHQEYESSDEAMELLARTASEQLDLERIKEMMKPLSTVDLGQESGRDQDKGERLRIGVLMDAAFQFYYTENLEALSRAGADLVEINALTASELPELDGLYIGGGFPETSARALAANESFRKSVKKEADRGLPIYAECGGLIYLGETILLDGQKHQLTGVFPIHFGMAKKPQAHGYSTFEVREENPFYPLGSMVKGHEFRYSTILQWDGDSSELTLKMTRGTGFTDGCDGLTTQNVLALYTHVHADGTPQWADCFLNRCRLAKKDQTAR
ncbi:MAG: cobyrinate a,c-diamide synthase [Thermodesulfobacteriota bacterium]